MLVLRAHINNQHILTILDARPIIASRAEFYSNF